MTANDTDVLLAAALQGAGLAFSPENFVAAHIESGDLIRVLDAWCKSFSGFYLYYPNKLHVPSALSAFIDFIKSRISPQSQASPPLA